MSWACLNTKSYYSLLHSPSKPIRIAERAVQVGLPAIALTDEGSITGSVAFMKALKDTCECGHHKNMHGENVCYGNNKKCQCKANPQSKDFPSAKIKPILGSQLYIKNNESTAGLITLSKNLLGWKKLISATSESNNPENIFKENPTLTRDSLSKYCDGNLIGISGFVGSEIADALFDFPEKTYHARSYDECRSFANKKNFDIAVKLAGELNDMFGKGNFYLTTQNFSHDTNYVEQVVANAMRAISKATGIPCVASTNSSFAYPEDFDDQRLGICSDIDSNYNDVDYKLIQPNHSWLKKFFNSDKYYIPTLDEVQNSWDQSEINRSLEIAEQCEGYNILNKPILPKFNCPNDIDPYKYLEILCREGWKQKIQNVVDPKNLHLYIKQVKEELQVIKGAGLESYFLIVHDYCKKAVELGQLIGNGRGSAAGSLLSYLLHITKTNPVKYGLVFERFYNDGRNTADRVSLPDIDTDFENRDEIIEHISHKYGNDHVAHMITFNSIKGKGSLKEVFRIKFPDIPVSEVELITADIYDESEINDKLQEMREDGEDPSIIMYSLESRSKNLKKYCYIDEQGKLQGEYAVAFRQAVKLEGIKKSQSKHPSGIVISNDPLADIVPMIYDSSTGKLVAGMEMNDLEAMGLPKFDILQLGTLKKLHGVSNLLSTGKL